MGLITTQHEGFGQAKPFTEGTVDGKNKADPKPVNGFNYAGQPMKEGDFYNGRPEHMAPRDRMLRAREHVTPKHKRTPEMLEKMRAQMAKARAALLAKKAKKKANPQEETSA